MILATSRVDVNLQCEVSVYSDYHTAAVYAV